MREIEIVPLARPLAASVTPPGSKSITNRAMILAAMADGRSVIAGALLSDDTARMAAALRALGFAVETDAAHRRITIVGRAGRVPAIAAELDAGNAGTAMRFLAGFVTLGRGRYLLDGSARMRERPIAALLETPRALGVAASSANRDERPPIIIDMSGAHFAGGEATIDASLSSQFVSALLMPAPRWQRGLRLTVQGETAHPFIAMTTRLMERWGAHSTMREGTIVVEGGQQYQPMDFRVEPDATAAGYFAAAAVVAGGAVTIDGLEADSLQGDSGFFALLERMGARVMRRANSVEVASGAVLRGLDITMNAMPDIVPTLAAIAPFASSPTRIRGVGFIRHHESDRLRALATELRRLGAAVEEFDDGLGIAPSTMHAATIETYDDHRIAMAFAIVGLRVAGVRITNPGCVSKTYPDFFRDLAAL